MSEVDIDGVNGHVDEIKAKLDVVEGDPTPANILALHNALGAGWEFLKSELGIEDAARSGGHKPGPEGP